MCSHEIGSVSDLLKILKEIGEPEQGAYPFFPRTGGCTVAYVAGHLSGRLRVFNRK